MATTRLMPLHAGKGRTVGQGGCDIIGYTENPQRQMRQALHNMGSARRFVSANPDFPFV